MSNITSQLIIRQEGEIIQTLPLNAPVIRIGRTPENGLPLPHQMVSRVHAELRFTPQGLLLTDLGSANGTFINKQRLLPNQPVILADGTTFRIGPFFLKYQTSASTAQQQEEETRPTQPIPTIEPQTVPIEVSSPTLTSQPRPEPTKPTPRHTINEPDSIYNRYLPDIFQENDFLKRFLHIFEDIWEPLELRQDHIEMYFDPHTCPTSFLPWLASWLEMPLNPRWPERRQRHLLAQAMDLYDWRGTAYGLTRMIEICTGITPEIRESSSQPFVFHIRITLPPAIPNERLDKDLLEELIRTHKPAHAGYILEVNS